MTNIIVIGRSYWCSVKKKINMWALLLVSRNIYFEKLKNYLWLWPPRSVIYYHSFSLFGSKLAPKFRNYKIYYYREWKKHFLNMKVKIGYFHWMTRIAIGCKDKYRKSLVKCCGAFSKLKISDAALNQEQHLFRGGRYWKYKICDMNISFSFSKNNQVYKLNTKHSCHPHPLRLDQAVDRICLTVPAKFTLITKKQRLVNMLN